MVISTRRSVLREGCRQAVVWQTQWLNDPPLTISVNLSAEQLDSSDLVRDVEAALRQSGLPPESLVLEITDSVLMRNTDKAIARVEKLKSLGVRLAIDDFGTGFSSVLPSKSAPQLAQVPKPFLDGLGDGGQATSLVRGIVDLERTLGLTVVAERVEQARQWECLEELSCDLVQGYYFARPQSAERIEALLRRHSLTQMASPRRSGASNGSGPLAAPAAGLS